MTERMTTDVLVVGGSIAGLAAAITAKEKDPSLDVTVVEKYTSGYSGKANRGAGIMLILGDSTPEEFAQFYLKHIGLYLNNQTTLLKYAGMLNSNADALDKWSGGKIDKGPDGKLRTLKWASRPVGKGADGKPIFDQDVPYPWTLVAIELDYMREVRKYARKLGVKFVDRTGMVDLLTDGGKVAGIVGYDIDKGTQVVMGAKSVVLGLRQPVLPGDAHVVAGARRGSGCCLPGRGQVRQLRVRLVLQLDLSRSLRVGHGRGVRALQRQGREHRPAHHQRGAPRYQRRQPGRLVQEHGGRQRSYALPRGGEPAGAVHPLHARLPGLSTTGPMPTASGATSSSTPSRSRPATWWCPVWWASSAGSGWTRTWLPLSPACSRPVTWSCTVRGPGAPRRSRGATAVRA